jgi:hypothetical protein
MRRKFYRRHIFSFPSKRKRVSLRYFILLGIGIIFFCLFPLFQILTGPFGSFIPFVGPFWNSHILVLIQNEAELRPSGGFLSAVGIVNIKNGVPHIAILDSYSIAEPPNTLQAPKALEDVFSKDPKYRGWVFRDSNFFPDFPSSAQNVLKFLEYDPAFSDISFDAVISVNFKAVEDIFAKFGPINGFSETNLFHGLQRETKNIDLHSEQALQERKNVLGESAKDILKSIGYWKLPSMLNTLANSADKKDIQVWSPHSSLQEHITKKNWDGSFPSKDFFSVNITNLGAKKSDRYLLKYYSSDISLDATGKMKEKFSLRFRHLGGENLYSGPGFYFIRIYRPHGTILEKDQDIWSQKIKPEQWEEFSTTLFLKPGEEKILSLPFLLPGTWMGEKKNFLWITQSGNLDDLTLTLRHSGEVFFSIEGCDESFSHENVSFCFSRLEADRSFSVSFSPDIFSPIVENVFFEDAQELFVRFSEPVSQKIAQSSFFQIFCKDQKYHGKNILRNEEDPRDVRIVLNIPTKMSGEFCHFEWTGVSDEFHNSTTINMTLPLRGER